MCRGMVGTLVQVGQGKIVVAEMERILASRDRRVAGMTAPAQGWFYGRCFYEKRSSQGERYRSPLGYQDCYLGNHAF